jgi:hypothetical protein
MTDSLREQVKEIASTLLSVLGGDDITKILDEVTDRILALLPTEAGLRKALKRYGNHDRSCDYANPWVKTHKCTCGFDAAPAARPAEDKYFLDQTDLGLQTATARPIRPAELSGPNAQIDMSDYPSARPAEEISQFDLDPDGKLTRGQRTHPAEAKGKQKLHLNVPTYPDEDISGKNLGDPSPSPDALREAAQMALAAFDVLMDDTQSMFGYEVMVDDTAAALRKALAARPAEEKGEDIDDRLKARNAMIVNQAKTIQELQEKLSTPAPDALRECMGQRGTRPSDYSDDTPAASKEEERLRWYQCSNGHREPYPSQPKKCPICKCPMDDCGPVVEIEAKP